MSYFKPLYKTVRWPFKRLKLYLKQKAGWLGIPKIIPYRGYGNETDIFIKGRVIEDKGLAKPTADETLWQNILATLKRYISDEIAGVKVRAAYGGETQIATTDELGYFHFHFKNRNQETEAKKWYPADFELLDDIVENQPVTRATGKVWILSPKAEYVLVSDIDDTIMISHSTQLLKKIRLLLFRNAYTRLPFPGTASFYRALAKGRDEKTISPFFYVSSSEWNLYDLLDDFFNFNEIPEGVFMLRTLQYSIFKIWKSGGGNHIHKYEKIKVLLETYRYQQFILLGDNGQRDPLIYYQLALEFPGRISAIYIRKVKNRVSFKHPEEIHKKLSEVNTLYTETESSYEASLHAFENGFTASRVKKD